MNNYGVLRLPKRMLRRTIVLLIVLLMVPSFLAARGAAEGPQEQATFSAEDMAGQHLNISWMGFTETGYAAVAGTEVQRMVEREFNVTLDVIEVNTRDPEQVSLLFAGGTIPDSIIGNPRDLIDQSVIRPIDASMLYRNMPAWMKTVEGLMGEEHTPLLLSIKGDVWGIPYDTFASHVGRVGIVRKDWMDNVGITRVPETVEEMEDMLRAFTFGDPNQSGKDDTYGWHVLTTGYVYWGHQLMGAYGIQPDSWYAEDGKVFNTSTTDGYKNALKRLNAWYEAGYIDPEFVTDNRNIQRDKWSESKFGYLEDAAGWVTSGLMATNIQSIVLDKNPNAEFVIQPAFRGPDGRAGARLNFPNFSGWYLFGINTSDAKVQRIMEIYERCASDRDWYMRMTYGNEGQDWWYREDGSMELSPAMGVGDRTDGGLRLFSAYTPLGFDMLPVIYTEEARTAFEVAMDNPKSYWGTHPALIEGEDDMQKLYKATLSTIVMEFAADAVTGNIDIDREWDRYVRRFMDAGGRRVLAELQANYDRRR